jgi:hypothetical protein
MEASLSAPVNGINMWHVVFGQTPPQSKTLQRRNRATDPDAAVKNP